MENNREELTTVAYEIDLLTTTIDIVLNYISYINLMHTKAANRDDRDLLFYSLFGTEKGMANISDNLENINSRLNKLTNKLLDFAEAEKGADTNG